MRYFPFACVTILLAAVNSVRAAEPPFIVLNDRNEFYATDIPPQALNLLKKAQQTSELKSFAFTPGGDWVFFFGAGFYTSNPDLPACKKLTELMARRAAFKCVAFSPAGGWTIFWGKNGNWTEGSVPSDAFEKFEVIAKKGGSFRSVAYGPDGSWVILYDKTGLYFGGCPDDLTDVLTKAGKTNVAVRWVAFAGKDWLC